MSRPLDDAPDELLDAARRRLKTQRIQEDEAEQGRRLASRIFISFVLIGIVAVVFFVVLPHMGLYLPPIVPIATAGTIAVGAILSFVGDKHPNASPDYDDEQGGKGPLAFPPRPSPDDEPSRPFGCCSGPGHMRCLGDKHKR